MLSARGVSKSFESAHGTVRALEDFSISIEPGERVGLVGPSGCGKSTLARILTFLLAPNSGTVTLNGTRVTRFGIKEPPQVRRRVQMLWQSPRQAADPRRKLADLITEPGALKKAPVDLNRWAEIAGVPEELLQRYPHEVSEGQLQRAMVARALACEPDYLVGDEPTSMLDVSSQAGVLRAIETAQARTGLGVLLISHDAELVGYWCRRVLRLGDPAQASP